MCLAILSVVGAASAFSDVDSVGLQNTYPGAFFLALNDGGYRATVGFIRLTYRW